ncbi:hypothetical protein QBC40DRAFT_285646 [Triangularia verruculosa]|uniref:Uncharacterized protein n=1 Tax=Triangularia verruculosa TaxID=2587418 RepID=A0AAN7ATY0_9PEZI|nr:hypothetical protein QBC40DRAFT_285646 [Triangularia verruculosa]
MGKPTPPAYAPGPGSSADAHPDAVSLHTPTGVSDPAFPFDSDTPDLGNDDLPPLYSDIDNEAGSGAPLLPPGIQFGHVADLAPKKVDEINGAEIFVTSKLESDPKLLENQVGISSAKPPRPFVQIHGSHRERVEENGKSDEKDVTDFRVLVELTPYLFSDVVNQLSWRETRTVENSEKACRGTVFRRRAPGYKQDIEVGTAPKPTLAEWCHRYCASHAALKCFVLRRRVIGFNEEKLRSQLESLVRGTNYRGDVRITFPVRDEYVYIYNDCWINRWRWTTWIRWVFYLTFLWIFSWPFFYFSTKTFEVVTADWGFSRPQENGRLAYVSISEDHIYNTWARAISRAILGKRQACLDHNDLVASHTDGPDAIADVMDAVNAPSFVRRGAAAMTHVNRQLGWGGDWS